MTDGRKTLGDISRAVNNFDRNPTRVLFGASNNTQPAQAQGQAPAPAPAAAANDRKRQ
jgi:phospholipid/cholesterol/gamma-HCH transport system substrate-binding protein